MNLNKIPVLILTLLTLSITAACTQTGAALLNALAKNNHYVRETDLRYGEHEANTLDVYHPAKKPSVDQAMKKPVLIFFYGGCWGECNSIGKADYLFVAQPFVEQGYVTVIPRFREYPKVKFSSIMDDAAKAVHWVTQNITHYGGDPDRIILMGHSSGAHIASMLALSPRYLGANSHPKIRSFVGLAGPYDFLPFDEAYQRKLFAPPERYRDSQPINFVTAQSPPALILHGEKDTTVGKHNAINLVRKSQALGGKLSLRLYPEHNHVGILLALSRPLQHRSTVLKDILLFMNKAQETDKLKI